MGRPEARSPSCAGVAGTAWPGILVYTNGMLCGSGPLLRNAPGRYFIAIENQP